MSRNKNTNYINSKEYIENVRKSVAQEKALALKLKKNNKIEW